MEFRGIDYSDGSGLELFEGDINNIEIGDQFFH